VICRHCNIDTSPSSLSKTVLLQHKFHFQLKPDQQPDSATVTFLSAASKKRRGNNSFNAAASSQTSFQKLVLSPLPNLNLKAPASKTFYILVYMHEIYLWFHIHLQATRQLQMESSIEKALKYSGLGNRDVTPFMKLRVVGLTYKNRRDKPKEGIVTIWNPTQKQVSLIVELQRIIIFPNDNKFSTIF
jgi:hypothetical protein